VTASHNPEPDNGVKIVDADGGMLAASVPSYPTPYISASLFLFLFLLLHLYILLISHFNIIRSNFHHSTPPPSFPLFTSCPLCSPPPSTPS
jgi:hypothetical protein